MSVGRTPPETFTNEFVSLKKLKPEAKKWKNTIPIKQEVLRNPGMINETAEFLVSEMTRIMDNAKVKVQRKKKSADKSALDSLEEAGDGVMKNKVASKNLFEWVRRYTAGVESDEERNPPPWNNSKQKLKKN